LNAIRALLEFFAAPTRKHITSRSGWAAMKEEPGGYGMSLALFQDRFGPATLLPPQTQQTHNAQFLIDLLVMWRNY
jgi:hypothetical protein